MTIPGIRGEHYLSPEIPDGLPWLDLPVVDLSDPRVEGLAVAVAGDPHRFEVPVVPWPGDGRRELDPGTGVGGGVIEGAFRCAWVDGRLVAVNEAVGGRYVIGLGAGEGGVALWHVNHHPDGGQLFAALDGRPFLVPAIPPGPDPDLDRAVAIRSDGSVGVCLLPGVWHDGVYPASGDGEYLTRQGRVHARVSCDVAAEFGVLLRIPLG